MTKPPRTTPRGSTSTRHAVGEAGRAARAAIEARPEGVLSALFASLDAAHTQATARVEALEGHKAAMIAEIDAEIEVAKRDLAATTTLVRMRDGKALPTIAAVPKASRKAAGGISSGGGREPRGDVPKAITALLEKNIGGMSRADIIAKLKFTDDKTGQTAVSNFLAASKKKGRIIHEDDGTYRLNV